MNAREEWEKRDAQAKRFFSWLDNVTKAGLESPAGRILSDNFFGVSHTGGGCLAWTKNSDDEKYYVMITHGDNDLGHDVVDPEQADWDVGIYGADGGYSDSVSMHGVTAAIAWCEAALKNPEPLVKD